LLFFLSNKNKSSAPFVILTERAELAGLPSAPAGAMVFVHDKADFAVSPNSSNQEKVSFYFLT
jgi:hypothetical protein